MRKLNPILVYVRELKHQSLRVISIYVKNPDP